jgi:predicted DNA repair protein MutK
MASGSLLALLDDIATILDDVALMTKVAAKKSAAMADDVSVMTKVAAQKTAGVLGDDLALNAQQVTGVRAEREIPVVWAVCKGSFINKLILVPAALLIGTFAPWAVTPLLMVGGAFLCFEGFEKLAHKFLRAPHEVEAEHESRVLAKIIAITLGTVATAPFTQQLVVLSGIAVIMTAGVYGLVAGIVKLDDLGVWLSTKASSAARALGAGILRAAPWLMKGLSIAGTAAMFLVGGGILVHGVPALHHAVEGTGGVAAGWPLGSVWQVVVPNLLNAVIGIIAGGLVLAGVTLVQRLRGKTTTH